MPAYNAGAFVASAIDSVLAQRGIDFELLVCDDASTDETRAILEGYRGDERVQLFANPCNCGAAATRNQLIRSARGRYLTPCDADDLLLPRNLATLATYLDTHAEAGTVYADILVVWVDDDGRITTTPTVVGSDCHRGWDLRENLVNHGGSMSRRELVAQVGGYEETAPSVDDWSLWLKLAEIARIDYLPGELFYVWRRHRPSLTSRYDPNRARESEQIIRAAAARRRPKPF
jgi:glycosyltransferase involved in cell wall biosynthesis